MAIVFDASGEYLARTSGAVINHNAAYTLAGWVKVTVNNDTRHNVFYVDAGSTFANYDRIKLDWFGGAAGLQVVNGGSDSGQQFGATGLTIDTYYHLAMVRESATSLKLYVNGNLEVTVTTSVAGRSTATRMSMGALAEGSEPSTGLVLAAWNAWSRALGSSEIAAQMAQAAPTDATSLWAEYLMLAGSGRGDDASANARHWTSNGTLTDTTNPAITYPSSGTTYTDAGSAASSATGSGADAATFADAGGAALIAAGSGAELAEYTDSATATSVFAGSGADAAVLSDTGAAIAALFGLGTDVAVLVDAGGGVLVARGSGADNAPADLPFQGDAYRYDSAGPIGSITGGTALANAPQVAPIGSVSGGTVQPGPVQSSPTGSINGGTVLAPEVIL